MFESGRGGGHEEQALPEAFHERRIRASLTWNPGPSLPPEKYEFGIGGDAVSCSMEALTCTFQSLLSRYSITFSIPPPPTLTISVQIWTNYETHIFKKWGYVPPDPLPRGSTDESVVVVVVYSRRKGMHQGMPTRWRLCFAGWNVSNRT